jgi:hypothetical protein
MKRERRRQRSRSKRAQRDGAVFVFPYCVAEMLDWCRKCPGVTRDGRVECGCGCHIFDPDTDLRPW